jgi:hypothetical protein
MTTRVRSMQELAARVYQRWREYEQRHPGMRVPINDTLSRILQHVPEYVAHRRVAMSRRLPLRNPGIFTLQRIAGALETTVGDLLGEPCRCERLSARQRMVLHEAMRILVELFDLGGA